MNKAFIVLYNGEISSEGYDSEEKAVKFIESRSGNIRWLFGWRWEDDAGSEYMIKEINVR